MTRRKSISAYTPSNTNPEILRRIFVQREKLLDQVTDRLCRSVTSGDKHHVLLVGPRGSGKTHFVSLVEWELRKRESIEKKMCICWLGEDDSFTGLIHLAFGIARQLATAYPDDFSEDFKDEVRGLSQDEAALVVLDRVVDRLKSRTMVLITENLDQTFRGLGDSGRKKWRAFLQETRCIATLATAQQLFDGVSKRQEVFFGFFDIQHFKGLAVSDAHELIRRIAVEQEKHDLVMYLDSAEGRYRVRALHYLAGGNHRMYVLLAEFLNRESLESLVEAFEDLAEELTPYFQERMRALPDQQRQLAQCLCNAEGALTVKQISQETFIEERTSSKQLGNLKSRGYVRSEKRGKESYYDMTEPLMRLCLEVKNQRGEPLRLVARFLRAWFPEQVLLSESKSLGVNSRADEYRGLAMRSSRAFDTEIASNLRSEIAASIEVGRYRDASNLAQELQFIDKPVALLTEAIIGGLQGDLVQVISKYTEVIISGDSSTLQRATALHNRGVAHDEQGNGELALADYTAVIEMDDVPLRALALLSRAMGLSQQQDFAGSAEDYRALVQTDGIEDVLKTDALFGLVEPLVALESRETVLSALEHAFLDGEQTARGYGGTPQDLLWMILKLDAAEWSEYCAGVAKLYDANGVADRLGQGVTQSIQFLDEGDYTESQRAAWLAAWHTAGYQIDDLQIPIQCLDAAVAVMSADPLTDVPLLRLPMEIRQLVRPLLNESLGAESE